MFEVQNAICEGQNPSYQGPLSLWVNDSNLKFARNRLQTSASHCLLQRCGVDLNEHAERARRLRGEMGAGKLGEMDDKTGDSLKG